MNHARVGVWTLIALLYLGWAACPCLYAHMLNLDAHPAAGGAAGPQDPGRTAGFRCCCKPELPREARLPDGSVPDEEPDRCGCNQRGGKQADRPTLTLDTGGDTLGVSGAALAVLAPTPPADGRSDLRWRPDQVPRFESLSTALQPGRVLRL